MQPFPGDAHQTSGALRAAGRGHETSNRVSRIRNSIAHWSRPKCDGHFARPPTRGVVSPGFGFTRARVSVPRPRDRKSTRLNSSHSQISYAVFCLKKKKKDIRTQNRLCTYTHNNHNLPAAQSRIY